MKIAFVAAVLSLTFGFALYSMLGSGGLKRMTTLSGVYAVCRPAGYDVVCFLDADSKDGGMFCIPLSSVGSECKK